MDRANLNVPFSEYAKKKTITTTTSYRLAVLFCIVGLMCDARLYLIHTLLYFANITMKRIERERRNPHAVPSCNLVMLTKTARLVPGILAVHVAENMKKMRLTNQLTPIIHI